ncbi:hypothetical protein FHL15_000359 [Xylaria flabelliformis]|uniref:Glycosyltransferase 61 catalytic domain-containing protein n=1 Tax=Xylaria flabelliformis TaxID=2512241 RepID=A0A553IFP4_9PEZI|nr:hypothetical protein FHL15_000359 [Xylaria flabelliformis]
MVDFTTLPFAVQVHVAQESNVLVGIHGAGLAHSMFMRQGAGAVVEILPRGFEHRGFRNIAAIRNLGYFCTHAKIISSEEWNPGEVVKRIEVEVEREDPQNDGHSNTTTTGELGRRDEWYVMDIEIEEDGFFEITETGIKSRMTKDRGH